MDTTGMRWSYAGANAVQLVRAARFLLKSDTLRGVPLEDVPRDTLLDAINEMLETDEFMRGMYRT
jgi:hypothetical protein